MQPEMCRACLKTAFPERHRCTSSDGALMHNFSGCAVCKSQCTTLLVLNHTASEEEDGDGYEESVEFDHGCSKCRHIVARHIYEFRASAQGGQGSC